MPLPRLIPCLDVADGRVVKGVRFEGLRDAGDPVELGERYSDAGADELVYLDVRATLDARAARVQLVERVAERLAIPFTVGGGVRSVGDADALLRAGADKVSVNSAAVQRPELIGELAEVFGSQCVVLAIDARGRPNGRGGYEVYTAGGRMGVRPRRRPVRPARQRDGGRGGLAGEARDEVPGPPEARDADRRGRPGRLRRLPRHESTQCRSQFASGLDARRTPARRWRLSRAACGTHP